MHAAKRHLSGIVQPPPPALWKIFHGLSPVVIPTTQPFFQGIPSSEEGIQVTQKAGLKVTKLPNQIVVATEDHHSHAASAGVFIQAGARHAKRNSGADAFFLSNSAFKGTTGRSEFATARALEKLGAQVATSVDRDVTVFSFESLSNSAADVLALVAESTAPRVDEDEVHEFADRLKQSVKQQKENVSSSLADALYLVAYGRDGLGNPLLVPEQIVDQSSVDSINKFIAERVVGSNIVVAAHGVNHDAFVAQVEASLGHIPAGARAKPAAKFVGGEHSVVDPTANITQFTVGFQGTSWHDADLFAYNVLQVLLGGGNSFSAGGPGKGMLSRYYRNILAANPFVETATAFSHSHDDTGIFGFHLAGESDSINGLVSLAVKEIKSVASGSFEADEVQRAKNQTAAALLGNLEHRSVICDDIGRQVLSFGRRLSEKELLEKIQAVSAQDLARVASKVIQGPIAVASISPVPTLRLEEVKQLVK